MPHSKMSKTWFYLIAVFALKHASQVSQPTRKSFPGSNHSETDVQSHTVDQNYLNYLSILFFGVKIQILHGIHELGSQQFEISKVRPFLAHCVFGHVSVLFRFPCMEIRDKDWNFYVGLEIVEGSGDFFFQPPFDLHFPPMLPLLNSWALGMKKWSKNRACQFRSVRPLKISKPRSVTNLKTKKNSMLLRG